MSAQAIGLRQEARDYADPLPAERDEDGDAIRPWTRADDMALDAAIAEAARLIEARMAERAEVRA